MNHIQSHINIKFHYLFILFIYYYIILYVYYYILYYIILYYIILYYIILYYIIFILYYYYLLFIYSFYLFITRRGIKISLSKLQTALRKESFTGCRPKKPHLLQYLHIKARPSFSDKHLDKHVRFWSSVLWSDETKLEIFGHRILLSFG